MSTVRHLWLSSHLLHDSAGAAAHRAAAALGPAVHELLLAAGDRLAAASAVLAQQYYRHAAAAWTAFGPQGFEHWLALGEQLAAGEPVCREGAMAYFAVNPAAFGPTGLEAVAPWCQLGRELARVSAKLAGVFLQTTATLLRRPGGIARLRAWAAVGRELYEQHGWQGEFLAQAYFAAAPKAVMILDPGCYRLWAGAGAALYPVVKEREFFGGLPRILQRWTDGERAAFLRGTLALAAAVPKHAYTFYRDLPGALEPLSAPLREAALRVLGRAAKQSAGAVADVLPVVGAVLRQIPPGDVLEAMGLLEQVAGRFPAAVAAALRVLPRLYEEANPPIVRDWFATGLTIAADNPAAGLAYFALESRTSLRVLRATSTAVTIEEIQGLLRKYIQMLSGQPVSVRGVEGAGLRPPLEELPGENEVALPLRVDFLATHEENSRVYRFLAAQLAGRREFGTYDFVPPGGVPDPEAPPGSALAAYLQNPAHPDLLEDFFLLAEGVRINHRLCAAYRGLTREASWVAERLLDRWRRETDPSRSLVFDGLFALALAEGAPASVPTWLAGDAVRMLRAALAPLEHPQATVQDSMRAAQALAGALAASVARQARRGGELDGLLLDKVSGDALLDPYYDEEPLGQALRAQSVAATQPAEFPAAESPPLELSPDRDDGQGGTRPISPEELKRLLAAGVNLRITQAAGDDVDGIGLYITDLIGKIPSEQLEALRQLLSGDEDGGRRARRHWLERGAKGQCFFYDEWDYHIGDYRSRWCRLYELTLDGDSGEFFNGALADYAGVIPEVRRQFQRIRPEMYRTVRGLEDGEDFDLNAAVDARVEVRAGRTPSSKLYLARKREERDVATLFLIDMSASTDEPVEAVRPGGGPPRGRGARRVIDVTKEALVVMAEALEEIGDAYAIYGFSGHGRENVEVYRVKSFAEALTATVKARMGSIEPKRSTRMGAALRHAVEKLAGVHSRCKHLFLLSDGFPQDFDYGQDRRSNVYGIRDTAAALREAEGAGIIPFCITVDKAGHDYLRQMCDESRYMVVEDIASLPRELPKIYQRVVRA